MGWQRLLWPAALLPLLLALPAAGCLGLPGPLALLLGALPLLVLVVLTLRDVVPACSCPVRPGLADAAAGAAVLGLFVAGLVLLDRLCR